MADTITQTTLDSNQEFTNQIGGVFDKLKDNIKTQYIDSLSGTYNEMVDAVFPLFVGLTVIWIVWYGTKIMAKKGSASDFMWNLGVIIAVNIIFMNFGYAWKYFGEILILDLPNWVDSIFKADPIKVLKDVGNTILTIVYGSLSAFEASGGMSIVLFVCILLVLILAILILIWMKFIYIYIMSFIKLTLLFMLTPVMSVLFCYKSTRNYTLNWMNYCAQPFFSLLLLNCLMSFLSKIFSNGVLLGENAPQNLTSTLISAVVAGLIYMILSDVPNIAAGLVSAGFNMSSERTPNFKDMMKGYQHISGQNAKQQAVQQANFAKNVGQEVAKAILTRGASLAGNARNIPKG